jgi:hypothetical protein
MKYLDDIAALVKTLHQSTTFHALVIERPPGWAKSTTIDTIMALLSIPYSSLGSYSTPLFLYKALAESPGSVLVLDDCAGLFDDSTAMSILKAATWSSAGSQGERRVTWGSSTDRVKVPAFNFRGKLILLTNTLPASREIDAFLTRTLYLSFAFDSEEISMLLLEAARSTQHYADTELSIAVARYFIEHSNTYALERLNLRTLKMAYEVARANPGNWQSLMARLLPKTSPRSLAGKLSQGGLSIEEQAREFSRQTGLSRRTFFNYRKEAAAVPEKVQVAQVSPLETMVADG